MARGRPLRQSQTTEADERLLITEAQRDPARFAELYDLYFDRIYAYIAWRAASRDEAEDMVSEVFQKALANLRRFEWRGAPFSAWLYRIAANEITDHAERVGRERAIESPPEAEEANQEEAHDRAKVFALMRELPADQRKVLELRFMEEKSTREVAEVLQRSEGAIKQLQFRGLENLRAMIGGKYAFLQHAFGAEELEVYREHEDGPIRHAKIRLGDTVVEMGEAHGQYRPMPTRLHYYVPDVDVAYQRALSAGAKSISAPVDLHHGERGAEIQDPTGNSWFLATPLPGART